jgi:hypothetical protein
VSVRERAPGKSARTDAYSAPQEEKGTPGKQTRAESVPQRTQAQQADREADLVNRGSAVDPRGTGPQQFPAGSSATPQQRHDAAEARLQLIDSSVAAEDTPRRGGQTKDDTVAGRNTVAAQLAATGTRRAAVDACAASEAALTGTGAATAVAAFEAAVRAYQDAYERTYLVSTDAAVDPSQRWEPTDWRDRLSNSSAREKLIGWASQPYVKFVVPVSRPNDVYVGIEPHGHIDIANDNALTAGIMKIRTNPLRVSELENSSGGYRPGPLRNAIVLSRLIDLGFVQENLSGTEVDHRPDGTYTNSRIRPSP